MEMDSSAVTPMSWSTSWLWQMGASANRVVLMQFFVGDLIEKVLDGLKPPFFAKLQIPLNQKFFRRKSPPQYTSQISMQYMCNTKSLWFQKKSGVFITEF